MYWNWSINRVVDLGMREIMYALESMKDRETIGNFIKGLDNNGCYMLQEILRYTDTATEVLWLDVYSNLFKGE
jgi:hypothetical protein